MPSDIIDPSRHRRLSAKAPFCTVLKNRITSLAEFLEVSDSLISRTSEVFWFRGHDDIEWKLCPSALRFPKPETRKEALASLAEFRRIQEYRLPKAPAANETFKWMQIAQHHGLPTRLLRLDPKLGDSAFFACDDPDRDGIVIVLNPRDLNRLSLPRRESTSSTLSYTRQY